VPLYDHEVFGALSLKAEWNRQNQNQDLILY